MLNTTGVVDCCCYQPATFLNLLAHVKLAGRDLVRCQLLWIIAEAGGLVDHCLRGTLEL